MIGVLDDDSTTGLARSLLDNPGPQHLVVSGWSAASVQGRQRLQNEDSWAQLGSVFVLSDGMGGLADGEQASSIAVNAVASGWLAEFAEPHQVVRHANQLVRELTTDESEAGCTLSAIKIARDQATVVHVGDSRVYRIRGNEAELFTRDHNLRSELLAAGITPKSSKLLGPLRALTSYLGKHESELQIDVRSISLRAGDRLVVCSDGVFGEMTHGEFSTRARAGSPDDATSALTSLRGSDDATAIVVDIGNGMDLRPGTGWDIEGIDVTVETP